MADPAAVRLLRAGHEQWNSGRTELLVKHGRIDLTNLESTDLLLTGYKFYQTDFSGSKLEHIRLNDCWAFECWFRECDLTRLNTANSSFSQCAFGKTQLVRAELHTSKFDTCDFDFANLSDALLQKCTFEGSSLFGTCLARAILDRVHFDDVDFTGAEFTESILAHLSVTRSDLGAAKDLDTARHARPSSIGIDTLVMSRGRLPLEFLRRTGMPDDLIEHESQRRTTASTYQSCFISYSSDDETFARRLHQDLERAGIRTWFAPRDLKIGDPLRPAIDKSIGLHDKLLIVLSKSSMSSQWVEQEVESALARERREKTLVLFPICVDDAIFMAGEGWAALLRHTRYIGDFRRWSNIADYNNSFTRLVRDLKKSVE